MTMRAGRLRLAVAQGGTRRVLNQAFLPLQVVHELLDPFRETHVGEARS